MNIAWFTPFSKQSAIGQFSSIVLEALMQKVDVTVYISDCIDPKDTWLPHIQQRSMKMLSMTDLLTAVANVDIAIYNLGDNYAFHSSIYHVSQQCPGIIILHDLVMHHFFADEYLQMNHDSKGYIEALAFSHGEAGEALGKRVLAGTAGDIWADMTMLKFPMTRAALQNCYGVVTHSHFAMNAVSKFAGYPTIYIPFPTPAVSVSRSISSRDEKIHFLSFGVLNRNKMIDRIITAIGQSTLLRHRVVYDVIGTGSSDYMRTLGKLISRYHLTDTVHLLGYQSDDILREYMNNADVILNLRNPHFGEASWALLEAAFAGKPTVVWKHGYYDEFPDDTVAKVTEANLVPTLEFLVTDAETRQLLADRILSYAHETFDTEQYCRQLLDFIHMVQYNVPLLQFIDSMAVKIAAVGLEKIDLAQLITHEIADIV